MHGAGPIRRAPWWGVLSSAAAPVLLIGGWTLAESRQPSGYNPVTDTISALAASGAADRWVMTVALVGLGVCHLTTALSLSGVAGHRGQVVLGLGGLCTIGVAVFALPVSGRSVGHSVCAAAAFTALALWPFLSARRGADVPWVVRPAVAVTAGAVLTALVGWFVVEVNGLFSAGSAVGLSERVAAGAQALWPLVVVLGSRRSER